MVRDPACLRELQALEGDHLLLSGEVGAGHRGRPTPPERTGRRRVRPGVPRRRDGARPGRTHGRSHRAHIGRAGRAARPRRRAPALAHRRLRRRPQPGPGLRRAGSRRRPLLAEVAYDVAVERGIVDGQAWLGSVLGIIRPDAGHARARRQPLPRGSRALRAAQPSRPALGPGRDRPRGRADGRPGHQRGGGGRAGRHAGAFGAPDGRERACGGRPGPTSPRAT